MKDSLRDVIVNDGLHVHATAFYWPRSRFGGDLAAQFERPRDLYIVPGHPLARINVEPITYDPGYVIGYARKSVALGQVGEGAVHILSAERVSKTTEQGARPGVHL